MKSAEALPGFAALAARARQARDGLRATHDVCTNLLTGKKTGNNFCLGVAHA